MNPPTAPQPVLLSESNSEIEIENKDKDSHLPSSSSDNTNTKNRKNRNNRNSWSGIFNMNGLLTSIKNVENEKSIKNGLSIVGRPTGLPLKSNEEQSKHLKAYRDMQKANIEKVYKERMIRERNEKIYKRKREQREEKMRIVSNRWSNLLSNSSNLNFSLNEKLNKNYKTSCELIFEGVPSFQRGMIWPILIGNSLNITLELYNIFLKHARKKISFSVKSSENERMIISSSVSVSSESDNKDNISTPKILMKSSSKSDFVSEVVLKDTLGKESSLKLISLDLPRTFPGLAFFQPNGPSHAAMENILQAYTCYRPDVGYVQGMSYLVAILLLYVDEVSSFIILANIINRPSMLAFFQMDLPKMQKRFDFFENLIIKHVPKVASRFKELDIKPDMFMIDWFLTLYGKCLPLDIVSRIWDSYLFTGEIFLFKVGLGTLKYFQSRILNKRMDLMDILKLLHHFSGTIDPEEFFSCVLEIKINQSLFNSSVS